MEINAAAAIGILGTISSIIFAYIGYRNGLKKESSDSGRSSGALMSDVGYIKAGVDDLKRKQETTEERHFKLVERVKGVEESAKQAHHRIDELREEVGKDAGSKV
ncbi:hypothetical protein EHE19_001650 [Ruminiclostridium herbifermentans]|uniref:Uncharacterized protein n=1 Tax=Ruminiclostridium herbifermentans TaxID=2488810 RepID=A0A4U7J980_9FIRM|nr:hypothetical protein [Ruminiclostridium herbifermentans]QNU67276.1 hypothetical protein EHE19_001650 [Ruminiclostridium herbifermentans]